MILIFFTIFFYMVRVLLVSVYPFNLCVPRICFIYCAKYLSRVLYFVFSYPFTYPCHFTDSLTH
ncbi:hypothetical protein C2G38_2071480 [Gigaspora rosea]|uniref:Uncharacterized protein n=1 Tax=Gigaspora rosea TaxID=44941 RepID=A0A397VMY7_9GLOM|nr:hypothetical protein C2G38_2071480 [Gigaspora rosea]